MMPCRVIQHRFAQKKGFVLRNRPQTKATTNHRISRTRAILITNIRNGKQCHDKSPHWEQESEDVYLLNQRYFNKKMSE